MTYILCDIEGTTTPITFVHDVLFPYAAENLSAFCDQHREEPEVAQCLQDVQTTLQQEDQIADADYKLCVKTLLRWISEDRKHPALKKLQGMIWERGYREGQFLSQIYEDVTPAFTRWQQAGHKIGIYSSGSIKAQKLLFKHTDAGDLTHFFSDYFDTGVGAKREVRSYQTILDEIGIAGPQCWFLSDVTQELDAAAEAGMHTIQLVRPGTVAGSAHRVENTFATIDP